jgi:hypothetical protein
VDEIGLGRLGWLAGIIDLRGYLSDRPTSAADRRLPTLAVTLSSQPNGEPSPVVSWLCERTAVTPIRTGKGFNRSGCGQHCPQPHVHVSNTYHRWIVGGAKAVTVLEAVLPFLVVKQDEARKMIALGMDAQIKPAHVEQMRRLGWPVMARA